MKSLARLNNAQSIVVPASTFARHEKVLSRSFASTSMQAMWQRLNKVAIKK